MQFVRQVNLVSDQEGKANNTDPNLVNAWGLAFGPTGAAWVSSAERGLSQVYDGEGNLLLSVGIPPAPGDEEANPTGQVFNSFEDKFGGDRFIFVTENGTISGWQPASENSAVLRVDNSGNDAIYKGVTLLQSEGQTFLYAADFHNRRVDVFDENYQPVSCHIKAFADPDLPDNYAPFNVMAYRDHIYVTYAQQDEEGEDDVTGPGFGFVDVFDAMGGSRVRLISDGALNAPWGMAFMPSDPESTTVRMLIGNFGDGRINTYDLTFDSEHGIQAQGMGPLMDAPNHPLEIDGLWAIAFGPGVGGFEKTDLVFTAGPEEEEHGLFGKLVMAPRKHHDHDHK